MAARTSHTIARDTLKDGEAHARDLKASSFTYTLVCPPRPTDGIATGRAVHSAALNRSREQTSPSSC
jgi:hypothetical protein